MDYLKLMQKYYDKDSLLYEILMDHSVKVKDKALKIAQKHPELKIDLAFLEEAAMLHDIGIFLTKAEGIGCQGNYPYICHGYLGADLLRKEGFPQHALVCERHTGVGLSVMDIINQNLPLPHREMVPQSMEEILISYADKFYSKDSSEELPLDLIKQRLSAFGQDKLQIFEQWQVKFN